MPEEYTFYLKYDTILFFKPPIRERTPDLREVLFAENLNVIITLSVYCGVIRRNVYITCTLQKLLNYLHGQSKLVTKKRMII